ncbi:MAG: hypothetical protein KKD73_07220 [Proteobacteria bacterium]|nr:hypothetical protein [Pseudomonadota bacterium]MBU1640230.1 hypothetical protein [Pseudomonadota bacterium]
MQWSFTKKNNRYALVGDRSRSLLAVKNQSPTGATSATPLGWADCSLSETKSVHQVMTNLSNPKGDVAISLPLDQFEVLTLSVNKVPREVVAKILPYHISKVLDQPLSEFIYDWLIVKELKDSLQINVFLFPAKMFQELRNTLGHYKLNPSTLEPDVFSVCAYLESRSDLQADEATLIALCWPQSISIAIYDKGNLILTRTVQLQRPEQPQSDQQDQDDQEPNPEIQLHADDIFPELTDEPDHQESLFETDHDDLLANFLIATKKEDGQGLAPGYQAPSQVDKETANTPWEGQQTQKIVQNWPAYINQVSLELMRTRDYFNSVIKGNQVKTVFVGGGEESWSALSSELESSLGIKIKHLMDPELSTIGDPLFEAVSIGVLS